MMVSEKKKARYQKGRGHTARGILLIGKDQQQRVLHFTVVDDPVKLNGSFLHALRVAGVNHENQSLCTGVVVSPEGSNLVLTTDIPDIELDILVSHAFDIESNCRNGGDVLVAEFELIENS